VTRLHVIDRVPFQPDPAGLAAKLKLEVLAGVVDFEAMLGQAVRIARPRACYSLLEVRPGQDGKILIGGEEFTSRVLRVNLEGRDRATLFVATCGREVAEWSESFADLLTRWVADAICEAALRSAVTALEAEVDPLIAGRFRGSMNPGSLEDWPLAQQEPLFRALGSPGAIGREIGVELTSSFLMLPRKSISGVRFAGDRRFADCLLCPREDCRGRRMPFDSRLFDERYRGARHGTLYAESCACGRDPAR